MRFRGFIGPAYTLKSPNVECQRCVNLYPEMNEVGTGKEGEVAHLLATPGLQWLANVGAGPIRMVHRDPQDRVFIVSANKMYKAVYSGSLWSSTEIGTLNTASGPVKADSNQLANGDSITVFVDGTDSYAFRNISSVETFGTFFSFGYQQVDNATFVRFIDGYFIFNKANTGEFYTSEWGSFNVDPLSFATSEGDPDHIQALETNNRDVWLFNANSTEVYNNVGNPDFPFERVSGGFIEIGCIAPYSVGKISGTLLWLGRDKTGQGIIYAAKGLSPQRISTHAIENAIQGYEIDAVKSAKAYTYQSGGHSFYVLNFQSATWVYDLSTGLWHERAFNNSGRLERHRSEYHAFLPQYGIHMVGDYATNKVYALNENHTTDDGKNIVRLRSSPHVTAGLKEVFCKSFQLDMEIGVGLDGGVLGSDPQVMMDFSDDGGHTFKNENWKSAGKIGEYAARVIWRRLGKFRNRVFRIRISDPVKVTLQGAELDVEVGVS